MLWNSNRCPLFYRTMATSTSFFKTPGNEFPIAGTSARTPCVPEINAFLSGTVKSNDKLNSSFFSPPACQSQLTANTQVFLPQRPGLCFPLNPCACAGREVQRASADAVEFSKHAYTVSCLLLYCAKTLGGGGSKA